MSARVTVGMPVYNGARYVREALDSLLAQDFADFELVCADNASTDETPQILADYAAKDERIRLVKRPETVIAYENYNLLVGEAAAPLFTWAACDDLRDPEFLGCMVDALDANPDAVLAYCNPRYFGDRVRVRSHHPSDDVDPPGSRGTALGRAISVLRVSGWLPGYGVIRTDALRKSRLFHYPMGIAPDVGLVIELAVLGRFVCIPRTLMSTRLRSDSLSRDLTDPVHFGGKGRRFDEGARSFVQGLPLAPAERRIFMREVEVYCRKAQKPRRGLWKWRGFRSVWARTRRGLLDLERLARRTG